MPNAEIVLKRQKRLALLAIGLIAIFAVAVTTTVGVSTAAIVQNSKAKENIESLKAKEEQLLENNSNAR